MAKSIIPFSPYNQPGKPDTEEYLHIAEFFCDTIQGEGIYTGHPAAFLRLGGCTLNCSWCDTKEEWEKGAHYSYDISLLLDLIHSSGLSNKLIHGQHLVLTGGSPLLQQRMLYRFLNLFQKRFGFLPFMEIENECTIMPTPALLSTIDCWNNSPKLSNSGEPIKKRVHPEVLYTLSALKNSWFKFVIDCPCDWEEIVETFVIPGFIPKEKIILMPKGASREEVSQNREMVVNLAIQHGVRYSTREHIVLWDKQKGV